MLWAVIGLSCFSWATATNHEKILWQPAPSLLTLAKYFSPCLGDCRLQLANHKPSHQPIVRVQPCWGLSKENYCTARANLGFLLPYRCTIGVVWGTPAATTRLLCQWCWVNGGTEWERLTKAVLSLTLWCTDCWNVILCETGSDSQTCTSFQWPFWIIPWAGKPHLAVEVIL